MNMQETTTILFVHGITEIGGAERELLHILDRLPQLGYRALVVCPERGPLVEELNRHGIQVRCAPILPWRKLFSYPRRAAAVRGLREVLTMERPALIHVNDIWWVPQALRAAAGLGVSIIAHVRQEIQPWKAQRYELDRLDLVLAVSRQVQDSLVGGSIRSEKLRTVYSGLDMSLVQSREGGHEVRHRFGVPTNAPLLGTVANLFPRKGYDVMLRALPRILASMPDIHYLIVGSGDAGYEGNLRSLAQSLGLQGRVHFAGFQESVFPCLAAMDLYVHPALMEGFGIAVLEAMAMSKPVVATRTGGLPEIIRDGETGALVPPGDHDSLAQTVVELLADPTKRSALGKAARDRIETHFTLETMMSHLTTAYGSVLRGQGQLPHSVSI